MWGDSMRRKLPLAITLGVLLVWVALRLPCPVRWLSGVPCPACGMSRACLAALRLDFSTAMAFHPMFWSVPLLFLFVWKDGRLFKRPLCNWLFAGALLGGFVVCWLLRLAGVVSASW